MRCLFIFILFTSSVASQAYRHFHVKTGASVTIPCGYYKEYLQHKKYWCSGKYFNSCEIQAYTNQTTGKVTVTDNPTESLFTVTIHNLNTGDTGWYWCAVEIDRGTDISEYLHITVKQDPDLSVNKSSVIGKEGAIITIQCLYSTAYRNTQKQWCRFKDRHCITFKTETSWDSRIQLSDDGRRFLSVNMSRLKKSDAGWYWCSAGDLQVPVLIEVNNSSVSTNKANNGTAERKSESDDGMMLLWILVALGLGLLFILVSSVTYMLRKAYKKENPSSTREKNHHTPPSALGHEGDVTYTAVSHSTKNQTHSQLVKDDEVTYGNMVVKDDQVTYGNMNYPTDNYNEVTYSSVCTS
ncbi:polymeric immunoglobulin receptor-like isoform X2 [Clarias gariepinus]|uniref:polymeric immunoglobulin receptor-like isoform X2 n=1 Tax=Clarias gariepinus TaxID=13013 RepID=UPI00234C312C|nr:polymeric immunoglobulin receptor-like isoform X2 [Clarias gariepinus]